MPRTVYWGNSEKSDAIAEAALALMQLGAEVIDPADIPTAEALQEEPGRWKSSSTSSSMTSMPTWSNAAIQ